MPRMKVLRTGGVRISKRSLCYRPQSHAHSALIGSATSTGAHNDSVCGRLVGTCPAFFNHRHHFAFAVASIIALCFRNEAHVALKAAMVANVGIGVAGAFHRLNHLACEDGAAHKHVHIDNAKSFYVLKLGGKLGAMTAIVSVGIDGVACLDNAVHLGIDVACAPRRPAEVVTYGLLPTMVCVGPIS